jgi:hypothetical protein
MSFQSDPHISEAQKKQYQKDGFSFLKKLFLKKNWSFCGRSVIITSRSKMPR